MKTPTISPELLAALRRLKLGQLAATLPDRIALAKAQGIGVEELLLMLLTDEITRRESSASTLRARAAKLDPQMVFTRWDGTAKVSYDKRLLQELTSLRFIEQLRNIVILGPVGVGKTFFATALGHLGCQQRHSVMFERVDEMLRRLRQSRMDNSRDALMAQLISVDLLILDDFALDVMSKDESRDIYQLFVERTGRSSTIVTSNRDTSEWLAMFDDALRAQSAIDRFKNAAYDLVIDGESYRPRQKPTI